MTKKEALRLVDKLRAPMSGGDYASHHLAIDTDGLLGWELPHSDNGNYRIMHAEVMESIAYSYNGDIA